MLIENDRIQKAKSLRMCCSWWNPVKKNIFLGGFLKNFPDFSDISIFEIVTDLHFFSYDLFIVRFCSIFIQFSGVENKKTWIFEIFFMIFLCSRNDFSRVKINKWQGEACFELKRVEAPLAKSSIVPSYALIPNKRFQKKTKTLFQPQFSFHKPFLKKWLHNISISKWIKFGLCEKVKKLQFTSYNPMQKVMEWNSEAVNCFKMTLRI